MKANQPPPGGDDTVGPPRAWAQTQGPGPGPAWAPRSLVSHPGPLQAGPLWAGPLWGEPLWARPLWAPGPLWAGPLWAGPLWASTCGPPGPSWAWALMGCKYIRGRVCIKSTTRPLIYKSVLVQAFQVTKSCRRISVN